MNTMLPWYIARAAGIMSWVLLAAATFWGLALSTKVLGRRPRPNWLLDMHRWLGGVALIFTVIHVVALLADTYVHFGLTEILVPFASSWHPVAVAWGVVAFYLVLAVELTSLVRSHISKRLWRQVHTASFVLFIVATIHGLTAGTDTKSLPVRVFVAVVFCAFIALALARLEHDTPDDARPANTNRANRPSHPSPVR
ncbi:MAG: ferric reductase-like transmembrane domain-containing protein [Acidimicrobiia bacterium]